MIDYSKIYVSNEDIHIDDSCLVSKHEYDTVFDYVEDIAPDNEVMENRSRFTLKMEWVTHTACYEMNILRSRTKDVDLNYPQEWYYTTLYVLCGLMVYPFVK